MVLALATLLLAADPAPSPDASAEGPPLFVISGRVTGCTGEHPVSAAVYDHRVFEPGSQPIAGILRRPQEIRDGIVEFSFAVPMGVYTITAFEDENGNGELDMGWFGPKEPSQFYRRFTAWRAPRFDDVSFTVDKDLGGAVIALR